MSQNIMTTCLICCWSSVCRQNSADPPRHGLDKTPEGVLRYLAPKHKQPILQVL